MAWKYGHEPGTTTVKLPQLLRCLPLGGVFVALCLQCALPMRSLIPGVHRQKQDGHSAFRVLMKSNRSHAMYTPVYTMGASNLSIGRNSIYSEMHNG